MALGAGRCESAASYIVYHVFTSTCDARSVVWGNIVFNIGHITAVIRKPLFKAVLLEHLTVSAHLLWSK